MVTVYATNGKSKGTVTLPKVFYTPYRPDVIQRAVVSVQAGRRTPYGTTAYAGLRTTADYFGRRKKAYRMTINRGMSRLPREKTGGGGLGKVRRVPQSRGGRRAHPPKPERVYTKKINKREHALAFKSAVGATTNRDIVAARGHLVPDKKDLPLVVEDAIQSIAKTKELLKVLEDLGFAAELARTRESKLVTGVKRMRGRGSHKQKKGVLIVVSEDAGVRKAASNIPGVNVETTTSLGIEELAPGTQPGRLVLWSKSAVEKMGDAA